MWHSLRNGKIPATRRLPGATFPKVVGGCGPVARDLASAVYSTIFNRTVPVSSPASRGDDQAPREYLSLRQHRAGQRAEAALHADGYRSLRGDRCGEDQALRVSSVLSRPGLGGHCIPIDPFYLSWKAKEFDFHTRFIELAGEINSGMPYFVVENVTDAISQRGKPLRGSRVLILGMAYKRDIDDLRESPSLTIIELTTKTRSECRV